MSKSLFERTSFNWITLLSMAKVQLDLISNPDIYLFFGKDTRGGVSYISKRYSEANIKF